MRLSIMAREDLPQALKVLKEIDLKTLAVLQEKLDDVHQLADAVRDCIERQGRIFLCGCGATGRLSLTLETVWRRLHPEPELCDRVIAFMAGGDIALIKAVEEFEDFPNYGARQLVDLGFSSKDLLISSTEGGETPFVIGATEKAAELSELAPYFLYCNPDEILAEVAERSKRVLDNQHIRKVNLTVGPMAISGSTRMQATTSLMLAVGLALNHYTAVDRKTTEDWHTSPLTRSLHALYNFYQELDISFLNEFIVAESSWYQKNGYLFYKSDPKFALTILTDTTERAPTFSLSPFENLQDCERVDFSPALCYLLLAEAENTQQAWRLLLGREPRALDWNGFEGRVDLQRLYGHDFSRRILQQRESYLSDHPHAVFTIKEDGDSLSFQLQSCSYRLTVQGISELARQLVLKMLLNSHSSLVMGRLGRYEGNLMTWVRPSNNKLIDRTIRYVRVLLEQRGINVSYEDAAVVCFQEMETTKPHEPIVLKILSHFL
ncbi:hypothetical protein CSA57_10825 [candidate division KSB3 bacterium]|nr:MAG: hypothetical protein CSA57_10825 [candidate division KSB3 bacterium]